ESVQGESLNARPMIAQDLLTALQGLSAETRERPSTDCPAFTCPIASLADSLKLLRDNHGFDMLSDATAIDNGVEASPRFTVVYHLLSTASASYVRIAADCLDSEDPVAPSVTHLWA